ncbi:large conductance mechanosensitive channel protein MscL [Conexibacter sp. W3-3-2]|uniref:Large-conductance mechanosensitive channel n=1 Tax=Paraconexibacter algicola TaxID=2133960 RepID=A0A2T4UCD9_9ACTN|nr:MULTISPECIES: large conductance mechanosensitive channel protein MscL [Solirubrobacterales]MTD43136.1 large conductance mechanosensitive channel protein MscL [Conexibacter sp. W3-3-2]PTL54890.1 large conductance mechanosensitive channel protein MscL [Paraconexibacter algicola]
MVKGFKEFLMRGNVIDLAVAVIIGAAFGAVVKAFADDFIGGLIGVIGGTPNFDTAGIEIGDGKIIIGTTITALINFVIVAAVIYFVIVLPMKTLAERGKKADSDSPAPTDETVLLTEIRDLLKAQQERGL